MGRKKISELTNAVFSVCGEAANNGGTDSISYNITPKGGMICTAGGCTDIDASINACTNSDMPDTYAAARCAAMTVFDIFGEYTEVRNLSIDFDFTDELCADLTEEIGARLAECDTKLPRSYAPGLREMPASVVSSVFNTCKDGIDAAFIWAGNSRGYILTDVLMQVSEDDIDNTSPSLGARRTNVLSADGDFHLNCEIVTSDLPVVLITASDGCFSCFSTPMEFEYMLLETLARSSSITQWHNNIYGELSRISADDFAMCIAVIGYDSFSELNARYRSRAKYLNTRYISRLNSSDVIALCRDYRKELGTL